MAVKHAVCDTGFTVTIYKGLTFSLPWAYQNPDGTGIDLTGKSIVFRLILDDTVYDYTETANSFGSSVTITDVVNGEFTVKIAKEETATFEVVVGKWALLLRTGSDDELLHTDVAEVIEL